MVEITRLIAEHHHTLYRFAFRLTGSAADAEALTQEAFLVAQQRLHQLRDESTADRWLLAVVRSCFLKSRRRKRPMSASAAVVNVDEIPEDAPAAENIDQEALQRALSELPDDYRLVVVMFYFEQRSYKEIAETLRVPMGTVMSRLSRAKGQLRQRLLQARDGNAPGSAARQPTANEL